MFRWQSPQQSIVCHSDSDWAGDRATRRSVSGGAIFHGSHCLRTWAKMQSVIAKSSAEAELYAAGRSASEALGTQAFFNDLGVKRDVQVLIDSSSALSLISKAGLGQAKHIEIQHLWLQEATRRGRLKCSKVHTDENGADLMTKPLPADRVSYLMRICGYSFV